MAGKDSMSLQKFLVDNRLELIERTQAKLATRRFPQSREVEMKHGVPAFLSQLGAVLREQDEQEERDPEQGPASNPAANAQIVRSAALHGQDLRRMGFTIEQVVRGYGDVCQAVTELAGRQGATLTITEFHTLNRCLDNAIAGAVASWDEEQNQALTDAEGRLDVFRRKVLSLIGAATVCADELLAGHVGTGGTTAAVFRNCLIEMRSLVDYPKWVAPQ
jgi:hypothetical protein